MAVSEPGGVAVVWQEAVPPTRAGVVHNVVDPTRKVTVPVGVAPVPETMAE